MAITETPLPGNKYDRKWVFSAITVQGSTTQIINSDSCSIFQIFCDNTGNSVDLYLKIYDNSTGSGVTIGASLHPDFILKIPSGQSVDYTFLEQPIIISNKLHAVISKDPGSSNGSASDTWSAVSVTLFGTD